MVTARLNGRAVAELDPSATVFNVRDYGAVGDGVTDDTAAIQDAIDAIAIDVEDGSGKAVIPGGTGTVYRVDGTIVVRRRCEVELAAGAIVRRVTAAASTAPLFRLDENEAQLVGGGRVETEKASPDGVVLIGPVDISTFANVLSAKVTGIVIKGVKTTGNAGLRLWSSFDANGGATYQNVIRDVTIDGFGTGVYASDVANANEFHGVQFKNILDYCYDFYGNSAQRGADENAIIGGFVHASSNVTVVRMRNTVYNQILGLRAEPGGASAKPYDLDATTQNSLIVMVSNMATAGTDLGSTNLAIVNGRMGFHTGSASAPAMTFQSDLSTGFFRQAANVLAAATAGTERWRLGTNLSMLTNLQMNTNYLEFLERGSAPSTPAANIVRLFARDDGAGATELCFVDSTGTVKVIATA